MNDRGILSSSNHCFQTFHAGQTSMANWSTEMIPDQFLSTLNPSHYLFLPSFVDHFHQKIDSNHNQKGWPQGRPRLPIQSGYDCDCQADSYSSGSCIHCIYCLYIPGIYWRAVDRWLYPCHLISPFSIRKTLNCVLLSHPRNQSIFQDAILEHS